MMNKHKLISAVALACLAWAGGEGEGDARAQTASRSVAQKADAHSVAEALPPARIEALRAQVDAEVQAQAKPLQVMIDQIFSYAEPGFQEVRTSAYLSDILEKNGFTIKRGVAGMPTAFTATWGKGGPLIALGSDIDALLGLSQYPGIAEARSQVEGAPGHGEGHNSGLPLVIAAAIATKNVLERNNIPGRLLIWPGVAEELLAGKAYLVRDGVFDGVDACLFTHVSSDFTTSWGDTGHTGMVSVEYVFKGQTAHAGGAPWQGRSALDGVELMNAAWNYRREHLPLSQRSHYVITNGGEQPNIVPDTASVWYYFRERTFDAVRDIYETGNNIAEAAAQASGTKVERRLLGYAAPNYGNRALAEAAYRNIQAVGMPAWDNADRRFARQVQDANKREAIPLRDGVAPLSTPENRAGSIGGSDDIGDVMWTVPTITIRYPSNIPGLVGHNKMAAAAMATPIAHKGALVGARAVALTVVDLLTQPRILADARDYFQNVQLKEQTYAPVLTDADKPPVHLNAKVMKEYRPDMEKYYYDPARYNNYLEQLGIPYPAGK